MGTCQTHGNLRSPHSYPEDAFEDDIGSELRQADCGGVADCLEKSVASPPSKQKQNIWGMENKETVYTSGDEWWEIVYTNITKLQIIQAVKSYIWKFNTP